MLNARSLLRERRGVPEKERRLGGIFSGSRTNPAAFGRISFVGSRECGAGIAFQAPNDAGLVAGMQVIGVPECGARKTGVSPCV